MSRKGTIKRILALTLSLALALAVGGAFAASVPVYAQAGEMPADGNGIGSSTSVAASEGADGTGGGVGGAERASGENVMPTAPLALGTAPADAPGSNGAVAPGEDAGGDGAVTPGEGDNEESTAPTAPLAPHAATADAPGGEMPPAPQAINVITAFAPLESAALEYAFAGAPQTQDALPLPAVLAATVEGQTESVHVAVAWTPNAPYAGEMGETIFTAVPGEGYTLAEGVAAPQITVAVSRFGAGEPGARALSEYNFAHVAAINSMISNNGLGYNVDDPDNWDFAAWDNATPMNLTELNLIDQFLTGNLSLSGIETLERLECYTSYGYGVGLLTGLDVSGCAALTYLDCTNNALASLNISGCAALEVIYCYDNALTSLDVSDSADLLGLYCQVNELETLTLGTQNELGVLRCANNDLTALDLSGVDVTLEELSCFNNQITSLDVQSFPYLRLLYCSSNPLTELDVSGLEYLEELECFMNNNLPAGPLETLDISGCAVLYYVDCSNNILSSLNVSGCTDLVSLYCYWNELETLNVNGFSDLAVLDCVGNPFKSLTLPGGETLTVNVSPYGAGKVVLTGTANYGILNGPGITLTADEKLDYTFDGWTGDKNGASDTLSFDFDGDITVTANFSGGAPIVSSDATLHKVADQSLQNVGQQAGSSTAPITASVTVSSGIASISIGDLAYADFATVNLYSDATFSTEESVALNDGGTSDADTDIYVKVTAEDGSTIKHYIITVTRLASNYTPAHVQAINAIIYKNIGTQDAVKYIYMPGDPSAWDSFATWDKSSVPYRLTGLDFSDSGLTGEMEINGINTLTSLDVSGNAGLLNLNCGDNGLGALDVSGCTNLHTLTCGINRLSALNLSGLANLKNLACEKNDLAALDLSDQGLMENLGCSENDIQALDVSGMAALKTLFCRDNALSALQLSNCTALVELDCSNNSIENLDASNLGGLKTLFCMNNGMQTLSISGCSLLERLECASNELAVLDAENFPNLTYLNCGQNPMNSLALPGGETLTVDILPVDGGTVKLGVTNDIMQNTVVTLTATPETGYTFTGWTGDKSGANANLSFDFNSSVAVTANFAELGPPTGPYAAVGNVTVSGITGTALTAQSATITLTNETVVYSGFSGIDAGSWFANLPAGLTAAASATGAVTSGSVGDTITITFGGTPTAVSSAAFDITIPGSVLDSGQALAVSANPDAKFAISEAPSAGIEYTVIEHFGTFTGGGTRTASVDAAFGDFSHLEKDGTPVEPAHYEVSSGSTVITLAEGHMLPLDNGTHTYRAVFAGGYADLTLTVAVAPPDSSGTSGSDSSSSSSSGGVSHTGSAPKTGDTSTVGLWLALLGLSALGLGGVLVWCRKRRYKAK